MKREVGNRNGNIADSGPSAEEEGRQQRERNRELVKCDDSSPNTAAVNQIRFEGYTDSCIRQVLLDCQEYNTYILWSSQA